MSDFSDASDVDPDEIKRMVEDFDDLDDNLLGGSTKNRGGFSVPKKDTEPKKKVVFKDFDDDDPLADLLSDDETSYEKKKSGLAKSNLVADLFGIKNAKPEENIDQTKLPNKSDLKKSDGTKDGNIPAIEKSEINSNKEVPKQPEKKLHSADNKWQEVEGTNFKTENSQKFSNTKNRKSSLMEDLFGTKTRSAPSKEIDAISNLPKLQPQNSAISIHTEAPKFEQTVKSSSDYTMDTRAREPRRGRRNSQPISDPLGLFSAPLKNVDEKPVEVILDAKKRVNTGEKVAEDLPEWLGGSAKTKEKNVNEKVQLSSSSERINEYSSLNDVKIINSDSTTGIFPRINSEKNIFPPDMSSMIGTQFDQQAALISMQQQEHELKTAVTLSQQNEQVQKIVDNQRAKLDEQAKMFNALIKHQIDRQSMLETQMKIQQARIEHYIQTLMSQPTSLPTGLMTEEKIAEEKTDNDEKCPSPESQVKKLELERLYLENTVDILREKHVKEIEILEESHEKQISFLRERMEKLEKKMYEDSETLEIEYEKKIEKLKDEKEHLEQTYKEQIERLKSNEKKTIEEIYARHSVNVELLQKEHADTIEEISRAKILERQAIDTINNQKTDLKNLLERSQLIIESFQNYQKKLEGKDGEFDEIKETYMKKQEKTLQLLTTQVNFQQESLSEERKRLTEISEKLDTTTIELTAELKKKSLALDAAEERLATRERGLIREKQLFDEQMKWEREHLRVVKEAWIKEQERQMKLILDEREAVVNERAKSEVFCRLKSGADDMARIELEAALKTAQEAAEESNQERKKWQEKIRALDAEKCSLRDKEKQLTNRASELEKLTQSALAKREEGMQALKEAKRIERRYKEYFGHLQGQLGTLTQCEKKKAAEKFVTARERLATSFYQAEKPEKDITENVSSNHHINDSSHVSNSQVSTYFKDIVDPHLLLLKLNLDNKLIPTDDRIANMQVISQ